MADMSTIRDAADYYTSFSDRPNLAQEFNDIDDASHFEDYKRYLQDAGTQNFVLDFGNDDAWCAINLDKADLSALFKEKRPSAFGTRWINIWAPEKHKEIIKLIAARYGISERLQKLMCTNPMEQTKSPLESDERDIESPLPHHFDQFMKLPVVDVERAYPMHDLEDSAMKGLAASAHLTFSQVTNQIWHFCSVDYGAQYTCVGYNSLYSIKVDGQSFQNGKGLPDGVRLWSWLILCSDGTIISMQENPFPGPYKPTLPEQESVLRVVRRNIMYIFSGVSKQHSVSDSEGLVTIRVRPFSAVGSTERTSIKQEDGSSLIMYYIFDDWFSSYGLVSRREHKYGASMEGLRTQMLDRPEVRLVDELHWLGRRLAVLRRLYQSYELIMTRILGRQQFLHSEKRYRLQRNLSGDDGFYGLERSFPSNDFDAEELRNDLGGVLLSSAAAGRFERLVDRIKLYCLSEIDACLVEKESLTFLNFNLIALKDTQAVERMTRITILLAKVTIMFLPISLLTGYFSTQIQELQPTFTPQSYWISFAVLLFLSISVLAIFGYASDTVEGKLIYQSLVKTFFQAQKQKISHRSPKAKQ